MRLAILFIAVSLTAAGCEGAALEDERELAAGDVMLAPPELGRLERPAVAFPHDRHTKALGAQSCRLCHASDARGRLAFRFGRLENRTSRSVVLDLYHDQCMTCHKERTAKHLSSGPVVCGECHRRDAPAQSARQVPRFDLALHSRHVTVEKQACQSCHHVFDETARKLVYRKGTEEACAVCHGQQDQGRRPSLEKAAHQSCVACHLEQERRHVKAGPTTCEGCHAGKVPSALQRPAAIGRLLRGQRDRFAIVDPGARAGLVSFDHLAHEKNARFCTDCHHQSLAPCRTCHPLAGAADRGGGVNLDGAYHRVTSTWSCVGCHRRKIRDEKSCAGCHREQAERLPVATCRSCHQQGAAPSPAPASRPSASLPALPAPSDCFPEKVVISSLLGEYGPATLPHRKIVMRLDAAVRKSPLATALHGRTELLCAGCHHRTPFGQRPPPCRSCHGALPAATADRPALKAAYHRQCMGCHAAMGLKQGCTDCHAQREKQK